MPKKGKGLSVPKGSAKSIAARKAAAKKKASKSKYTGGFR